MNPVASQRLIDASATLEPADRALLNLMVNHGLDDVALAQMMHVTPSEIASRRKQMIARLSAVLGLPPDTVQEAVGELAGVAHGQSGTAAPAVGGANNAHATEGPTPAPGEKPEPAATSAPAARPEPAAEPEPVATSAPAARPEPAAISAPAARAEPGAKPEPGAQPPGRRNRLRAALVLAVTLLIAVALIVILSSGGGRLRTTPAQSDAVQPATARVALAGLPRAPTGVTGSVMIVDLPARPRLEFTVAGLPLARNGHYELWLFNSIIDSVPLATIVAPTGSGAVALPPDFRRYRWLDVSLQRSGSAYDSGESIVRAAMPQ